MIQFSQKQRSELSRNFLGEKKGKEKEEKKEKEL